MCCGHEDADEDCGVDGGAEFRVEHHAGVVDAGGRVGAVDVDFGVGAVFDLLGILRGRLGPLGIRAIGATVGKSVLAVLVMVEVGLIVRAIRLPWEVAGHGDLYARVMTALVKLPLVVGASAAVYFAIAWFLGMGELKDLPVAGRFFRRVMRAGK